MLFLIIDDDYEDVDFFVDAGDVQDAVSAWKSHVREDNELQDGTFVADPDVIEVISREDVIRA